MTVLDYLAGTIVAASALWLIGLAVAVLLIPERVKALLRKFASSARAHVSEQVPRLIAGIAFVVFSPHMRLPDVFLVFGWVLVATSAALLVTPWRWHQRYGQWVIPLAIRFIGLFAVSACPLGGLVLWAALWP